MSPSPFDGVLLPRRIVVKPHEANYYITRVIYETSNFVKRPDKTITYASSYFCAVNISIKLF